MQIPLLSDEPISVDAANGSTEHANVAGKLARNILDPGSRKDRNEFWHAGRTSDSKPLVDAKSATESLRLALRDKA